MCKNAQKAEISFKSQSPFIFLYAFKDRFNFLFHGNLLYLFRSSFRFCADPVLGVEPATMLNDNFCLWLSCHRRKVFFCCWPHAVEDFVSFIFEQKTVAKIEWRFFDV